MAKTNVALPGLIAAWRLASEEQPDALDASELIASLGGGESGLWLHIDLSEPRACELLARLPIPPVARRSLLDPDDAPHLEVLDGALFGCIADFEPAGTKVGIPQTGLLHMVMTESVLVTAQLVALRTVALVSRESGPGTPAEVLALLLHRIMDAVGGAVTFFSGQLSRIEDSLLATGGTAADRQALAAIRRAALRLERAFAPTAEMLQIWADEPSGTLAEPFFAPLLREARWEDTVRRGLLAVQERARITQDELAGLAAEETNRRLFVLAVMSAAFLPATLITGIFGMNVGSLPGVDKEWGFLMAMGLIAGSIAAVVAGLRFWRLL